MIKKLFTYTSLLLAMTACSVEDIETPSGLGPDGELTINLAVPEMQTVGTRANDFGITDVTLLVLSNGTVVHAKNYPLSGSELSSTTTDNYELKCSLPTSVRTKTGLSFYFVANRPAGITDEFFNGKTEAQLKGSSYLGAYLNANQNIIMSGTKSLSEILAKKPVELRRNIAKVTVRDGVKDAEGKWTEGTTVYPVEVYGTASSTSVIAGTFSNTDYIQSPTPAPASIAFTGKSEAYVHATKNPGRDEQVRPFMILKANYPEGSTDAYYYRLEFEQYDEASKTLTTLNVLPNHHYQVMIQEIKGMGDSTVEAAAKNPSALVEYDIYDYCPESYNMISDGIRELGVSSQLVHNGDPTTAANPEYVYVKLYSEIASELTNPTIIVESNSSWLSAGTPAPYSGATGEAIPGVAGNYNGVIYRIPVNFARTTEPGEVSGKLTVTWKGLKREIPVLWTREFDASDLCSVKLSIKKSATTSSTEFTTEDYWTFIRTKSQLDGISTHQNNGNVRNEGLHFPVNYGGPANRWVYEYEVTFNNLNDGNPYDWRLTCSGLNGIILNGEKKNTLTGTVVPTGPDDPGTVTFTISQDNTSDNWDYKIGNLKFEISKHEEENYIPYELDLYHTGFFDNPVKFRSSNHRMDVAEKDIFYYYEVIKGPGTDDYWLDRNLGATSAEYYIEMSGGNSYYGNQEAAGGYYSVADYVNGGTPTVYSDLCPPGFSVPRVEQWNTLRNSPDFVTSTSGNLFQAEYTNSLGQKIYFPRCLFYDNDTQTKTGESRTGYYWSCTAANGLEKDQIGNWFRYLKLSGSISSYDNGQLSGRLESKGSAMSVRCVSTPTTATSTYRTFFNVSGATHVFLYSETNGVDSDGNPTVIRNSVTNWPGTSIGNYRTMGNEDGKGSGTQIINFSYESPNTLPEDFYVMFTFRDINGIWHTMSKGNDGNTIYTTDVNPRNLNGWKVVGDTWNGKTTALNGFWRCNFSGTSATVTYDNPNIIPPVIEPVPNVVTVYYTNPENWSNPHIYMYNGSTNNTWPGQEMTKISNNLYSATVDRTMYNTIIFNDGVNNSGNQTGNISLQQKDKVTYSQKKGEQ